MSDPHPRAPPGHDRLGIVERLASILQSLTLQNVLVAGILVVLAIPSYAVWQVLHDQELRKEIMSFAKEQDMGIPCQSLVYSFSGQNEKSAVISGVQVIDHWEIVVGTRQPGVFTAKEAAEACTLLIATGKELRAVLQRNDAMVK